MYIIKGETRPKIGTSYKYSLIAISENENLVKIASDNTRVVHKNMPPKDLKEQSKVQWKIYLNNKVMAENTNGSFNFLVGNQAYTLVAVLKGKIYSIKIITLGGTPKIEVYWLDDYRQKIINKTVGYLDKVYLIIKTSHIPVGDTLSVTIYEDEKADGHGDSSRRLGTYSTSAVNKNGYASVYFSNLQAFRTALNKADYYDESEHEFYAKVVYDSHIAKIYEKTQLRVKNELWKLIEPPVTNMPVTVGEVDKASTKDDRKKLNYTFGIFIDGTMNNKYNTIARTNWEKKRLGEADSEYNEKEHLKIYAKNFGNVKDSGKYTFKGENYQYKYGEVSYENELSNPAILFENYEKVENNKVFKIYTEGMGTNTLTKGNIDIGFKERTEQDDYRSDDLVLGSGMGIGSAGIIDRVTRAIEQMTAKIKIDNKKEKINTITIDIFGFSRGSAAARHFIHEITLLPYKAKEKAWGLISYKDHSGRVVDDEYALKILPSNGYFGYLLTTKKGIIFNSLILRFAGLYDTVAHHGPVQYDDIRDLGLNSISKVKNILHMTAGEEHRYNFSLSRINRKKNHIELNLPGVHCDVGGSYVEGRPEGNAPKATPDPTGLHIIAEETVDRSSTINPLPGLEKLMQTLIDEGWYKKNQIEIKTETGFLGSSATFSLVSHRDYVSNQYSFIPLQMMCSYGVKKEVPMNYGKLIKKYEFNKNTVFSDNISFLKEIKAYLETYAEEVEKNPTALISYQIPEEKLHQLRNRYLHYNAVIGLVNKPEPHRKRGEIKP